MSPEDLRKVRESFGMTGPQFARLLRIHRNTWHKWETGEQQIPAVGQTAVDMLLLMRQHNSKTGILMEWIDQC